MDKPLEGIKVIEVAMWAFVPSAGAMLSNLGADVIKIEPLSGDPIRGLQTSSVDANATRKIDYSWENYNRGKRSVTLDLKQESGREVLMKLLDGADVFLTNLLPRARKSMRIDVDSIREAYPDIIYASGSGLGPNGPESDKGGYDSISYWARGGISATMTEDGARRPVPTPGPAFGDTAAGAMLSGAVCAALVKRLRTGKGSEIDVSLLGTAMWSMQRVICQATADKVLRFPRTNGPNKFNVLVGNYRTSDGRFIAMCMLQDDKYWSRFCELAGRPDLAADPRYVDNTARRKHMDICQPEIAALFESKTLAEWKHILSQQDGQWDVIQEVGEMHEDVQVQANGYIQYADYGDGTTIPMIGMPILFDKQPLPAVRSPELGADSDAVLSSLGYDEDGIIDLKVQGVVF